MRRDKGQALFMYAALIAVMAAALLAMAPCIKRAVQERYRQTADVFGGGEQYERGVTAVIED